MRTTTRLLILACVALAAPAGARFEVGYDHDANLRYQLDCLAGLVRCTAGQLPLADATRRDELDTWRDTTARRRPARPPDDLPLPTAAALRDVSSRHQRGWSAGPVDARARGIRQSLLTRLAARTADPWAQRVRPHLARLALDIELTARRIDLERLLPRLAALYGLDVDDLPDVSLIAIRSTAEGSLATLDNRTVWIETPIGESADNRLPVIVHEFVHHWQRTIPAALRRDTVGAFLASGNGCAMTAYHFFDEAVASAIGNGLIERRLLGDAAFDAYLRLPDSFYADARVDGIAKALLPRIERQVAMARPFDAAFVADYIELASAVLGPDCTSLAGSLHAAAFVLASPEFSPAQQVAQDRLSPATAFVDTPSQTLAGVAGTAAARYPALSGIVIATPDTLDGLQGLVPDALLERLARRARAEGRLVHAWRRNQWSTLYLVVGADVPAASAAVLQLVALREQRFSGEWLPPPLPGSVPD